MHHRLIVALLVLSSGAAAQSPDSADLRLRPGDAVRLQVGARGWWNEPDVPTEPPRPAPNNDYTVLESGVALLPMVGLVRVAGRPFDQVRSEIQRRFGAELVDAPVLVSPVLRIAVLGEVQQPGLIPVDPTLTVADVIAAAGGLTQRGDPRKITLLREREPLRISLAVGDGGGGRSLRPGDRIVVGRESWFRENANLLLPSAASVLAATITALILQSR